MLKKIFFSIFANNLIFETWVIISKLTLWWYYFVDVIKDNGYQFLSSSYLGICPNLPHLIWSKNTETWWYLRCPPFRRRETEAHVSREARAPQELPSRAGTNRILARLTQSLVPHFTAGTLLGSENAIHILLAIVYKWHNSNTILNAYEICVSLSKFKFGTCDCKA